MPPRSPFDPEYLLRDTLPEGTGSTLAARRVRLSRESARHPRGDPPLCQTCGETDPSKFYQGWQAMCGKCRRRREKALKAARRLAEMLRNLD